MEKRICKPLISWLLIIVVFFVGTVQVLAKPKTTYNIIYQASMPGGSIEVNPSSAETDDEITIIVHPIPGYQLSNLYTEGCGNGKSDLKQESSEVYTFQMCNSDISILYSFEAIEYGITIQISEGGTVTSSQMTAYVGDEISLTPIVDIGFGITKIEVNGNPVEATDGGYNFMMPANDVVVTSLFELNHYQVHINESTGGTVLVSSKDATMGETITLTLMNQPGYQLGQLIINDKVVIPENGLYNFIMPAEDVTVTPIWTKVEHSISIMNSIGGSIVANKNIASLNDIVTLTPTNQLGYSLTEIRLNDEVIEPVNGIYSFIMPNNDITVTYLFEPIDYMITIFESTGGFIQTNKMIAHIGDEIIISPTSNEGYALNNIKMNGIILESINDIYSFVMPAANVTIYSTFDPIPVTKLEEEKKEEVLETIKTNNPQTMDYKSTYDIIGLIGLSLLGGSTTGLLKRKNRHN